LFFKQPCYDGFLFRTDADIREASRTLKHRTLIQVGYHPGDPLPRSGRIEKTLEMPRHWALHVAGENYYLERFYPPTNNRVSVSVIQKDFSTVAYHPEEGKHWRVVYFIQPLIRYLLTNVLALHDGIMLHGAAVMIGGRAFIFSGRSGSGKTTIAALFRDAGMKVLTDETIVIRRRDGQYYAYGTPWPGGGGMAVAESAPVGAICFISHGMENALRRADRKQAAKNILHQAVVQAWDPTLIGRIVDSVNVVASDVPCFEMPFVKDDSAVKFVIKNLVK
jgi:hypothetical protein